MISGPGPGYATVSPSPSKAASTASSTFVRSSSAGHGSFEGASRGLVFPSGLFCSTIVLAMASTGEDAANYKRAVDWLNETLDGLEMGDRKVRAD